MDVLVAERISGAGRRGSSRPIVAETAAGRRLVKLRGAAQGTAALVAEIVVAELAERLGLAVPARSLVMLPAEIDAADWDDELAQLLSASVGLNLGFDFLDGARDLGSPDVGGIAPEMRAAILWLDRLVMNPDRTARNPNLLRWADRVWLIDHGACLGFQYDWRRVTEASPREAWVSPDAHLLESAVTARELAAADEALAPRLTRSALDAAAAAVPASFLEPLLLDSSGPPGASPERVERRRAAYAAFLWKRLKPPRPFLEPRSAPAERPRGDRPQWLTRR